MHITEGTLSHLVAYMILLSSVWIFKNLYNTSKNVSSNMCHWRRSDSASTNMESDRSLLDTLSTAKDPRILQVEKTFIRLCRSSELSKSPLGIPVSRYILYIYLKLVDISWFKSLVVWVW